MQSYYLYRLSMTGVTRWKYVEEDYLDEVGAKSADLLFIPVIPNFPVVIVSEQYGEIVSEFDYGTTLFPGVTRYGMGEDCTEVFALQWRETDYILKIEGYLPICISGREVITFTQGEREIARIMPAPKVRIADEFMEADRVKRFEVEPEFMQILEILGAVVELRFSFS